MKSPDEDDISSVKDFFDQWGPITVTSMEEVPVV